MPYFITDTSPDCDGWATIKDDGEVIGCHETKQAGIDQMVAVSIAEGMEPGGERNLDGPPAIIVDIDGTLLTFEGDPIANVVEFVDEYEGEVIIVTGFATVDGAVKATAFDYIEHAKILSQPDADPEELVREALATFTDRNDVKGCKVAIAVPLPPMHTSASSRWRR